MHIFSNNEYKWHIAEIINDSNALLYRIALEIVSATIPHCALHVCDLQNQAKK